MAHTENDTPSQEGLDRFQDETVRDLDHDRWFLRMVGELLIIGEVYSLDTVMSEEIACGASQEEALYTVGRVREARSQGRLYSKCYSLIEPRGEIGFTPAATIVPISHEEFEALLLQLRAESGS